MNLPDHLRGAYIIARVEQSPTDVANSADYYCNVELVIADCNRVVELDFEIDLADERRNTFHKLDVLIGTLEQFRVALNCEAELAEQRENKRTHCAQRQLSLAI